MGISGISSGGYYSREEQSRLKNRISQAEQSVTQAEEAAAERIKQLQDQSEQAVLAESLRQEHRLASLQQSGYQRLRDLQHKQQEEFNQAKKSGERELEQLRTQYQAAIQETDQRGQAAGIEVRRQHEYEKQALQHQMSSQESSISEKNILDLAHIQADAEARIQELRSTYEKQLNDLKEESNKALERSRSNFEDNYQKTSKKQEDVLMNLAKNAQKELYSMQENASAKLKIYHNRQSDPFYQLVVLNTRLQEHEDFYSLIIHVPEYERQNVQVTFSGNQLLVSGYRRNNETIAFEDGRKQQSATYQSFHENFPLSVPADGKQLKQMFDGDLLIVSVPKLKYGTVTPPKREDQLQRARIEMPQFPKSIENMVVQRPHETHE